MIGAAAGGEKFPKIAEVLRFGDFELDRNAYELRRAGRAIRLERIPLDLLFLLAERGGDLVSREEILERIWGKGVFIDVDASINAAVRKARRALNDSADAPRFIVTVPAKGYRFVAQLLPDNVLVPEITPVAVAEPAAIAERVAVAEQAPAPRWRWRNPLRRWRSTLLITGLTLTSFAIILVQHITLRPPAPPAAIPPPKPALTLPNLPSIAVLPFANLSGDPQEEYFSDGISDQLITDLSRLPSLFVIARTSSFTFKNRPAKVQDIGSELGVKYLLEGSVLRAGNRVRVATHLVDAGTGADLWAERFERPLTDIFAVQDDIVQKIVTTLNLQLGLRQRGILVPQDTDSEEGYDDYLRASTYIWRYSKDGNAKGRQLLQKAIDADPKYVDAYVSISAAYWIDWVFQWNPEQRTLDRSFEFVR